MTGLEQLEQSTSSYFPSTPSQLPVGCLTPGPDGEKVHTSRGSVQSAPSSESSPPSRTARTRSQQRDWTLKFPLVSRFSLSLLYLCVSEEGGGEANERARTYIDREGLYRGFGGEVSRICFPSATPFFLSFFFFFSIMSSDVVNHKTRPVRPPYVLLFQSIILYFAIQFHGNG